MAKYLIHACPKRLWYVEEYLIPSMLRNGIVESNISVYNDIEKDGNLRACMKAFKRCKDDGGTWHLQDDVCICHDFKERTEEFDHGLVCGFSSERYDGTSDSKLGVVERKNMWFSFPCIRIPNTYARECADWVFENLIGNPVYKRFWEAGVNDDWAFRTWLKEFHPDCYARNVAPNLVDHVDYLLGGGTGSRKREKPVRAQYWEDDDLVRQLEDAISGW